MMKKMVMVVGLLAMMSLAAFPVSAERGEGYRRGPGMMAQEGYGARDRSLLDEGKLKAYDEAMEKHYKDTAAQRQEILVKQHEMATMLISTKTTKDELMEKQKELQDLMNGLQRKELSFRWDIHKKYPEMAPDVYGGCLGPAAGYGASMMGYRGTGMMGDGYYGHGMMGDGYYGQGMMDPDD